MAHKRLQHDYAAFPDPKRALMRSAAAVAGTANAAAGTGALLGTSPVGTPQRRGSGSRESAGNSPAAVGQGGGLSAYVLTVDDIGSEIDVDVASLRVQNHQLGLSLLQAKQAQDELASKLRTGQKQQEDARHAVNIALRCLDQLTLGCQAALGQAAGQLPSAGLQTLLNDDLQGLESAFKTRVSEATALVESLAGGGRSYTPEAFTDSFQKALEAARHNEQVDVLQRQVLQLNQDLAAQSFLAEKHVNKNLRLKDQMAALQQQITQLNGQIKAAQAAKDAHSASGQQAANGEVGELTERLQEAEALAASRLKEAEHLRNELQKAQMELRTSSGSASTVADSGAITLLRQERDQLRTNLDEMTRQFEAARSRSVSQAEELDNMIAQLRTEVSELVKPLEEELKQAKHEADRLRSERNKLHIELKKLDEDTAWTQLKSLSTALESRHKSLSAIVQVLRGTGGAFEEDQLAKLDEAGLRDLARQLHTELRSARAQVASSASSDGVVQTLREKETALTTLLEEVESTGEAFDAVQAKYQRALQQLKEKEDSERQRMQEVLQASQRNKTLKEQLEPKQKLIEASNERLSKLEVELTRVSEAERQARHLWHTSSASERQLQQQVDRVSADLKMSQDELESVRKAQSQLQQNLKDSVQQAQEAEHQCTRLKEELGSYKRRYERSMSAGGGADAVLEDEIRDLQAKLKCTACNNNEKDTVLTKCFHVFCQACVEQRIQTRQRKCPQCGEKFGAGDHRRLYLQ